LAGVQIEHVEQAPDRVQVVARTRAGQVACPDCGVSSDRLPSRYRRRLGDVAMGGRRMVIVLAVRRLLCNNQACQRRTFAEQVPGPTIRYGRRTPLLRGMLEQVAVALAGRAGARLAEHLHARASRSTLLRLLISLPDPDHAATTPRVLGVDDFALRRGQVYGTVLIDCQSGKPVDMLAGREAQPLADWLSAAPGR
jgi:transposase